MDYLTNHILYKAMYFIHEHFILKTRGDREEVTDSRRREGGKRQRGRRERRGMGKKVREHHDYSSGRYTRSLGDIQPHTHTHCVASM